MAATYRNLGNIKGERGPQGVKGDAGTFVAATAIALPSSAEPTVQMLGTPQARSLQLGIPAGAQGAPAAESLPQQEAVAEWILNPESVVNASILNALGGIFGGNLSQATITYKGAMTSLDAPRPAWPGCVIWIVPPGVIGDPTYIDPAKDLVFEASQAQAWTPLDGVPNLQGWWSAAGLTDASSVSSLADRSGNGRHFAAGAGTVTVDAIGMNGRPVLKFNGASTLLSSFASSVTGGTLCIWFVGYSQNVYPDGATGFFVDGRTASALAVYRQASSSGTGWGARFGPTGAAATTSTSNSSPHVFEFMGKESGVSELRIDGVLVASATDSGQTALTGLTMGARGDGAQFLNGGIGEMLLTVGTPTADLRSKLTTYLGARAGLDL